MTYLPKYPKPCQLEGKETLTPKQRAAVKVTLFKQQRGICACGCDRLMTLEHGFFNSATLEHIAPQPMGCAKRDNPDNLCVYRWDCNVKKGSKRIVQPHAHRTIMLAGIAVRV